nr:RHS repeat domain-containing protein [Candidatus Protofrankia californiensis]
MLAYGYDAAGQLVERTNGAGETVRFTCDEAGREMQSTAPTGRSATPTTRRGTSPTRPGRCPRHTTGTTAATGWTPPRRADGSTPARCSAALAVSVTNTTVRVG